LRPVAPEGCQNSDSSLNQGFDTLHGAPDVKNLGRGRASFGFKPLPDNRQHTRRYWQRYTQVEHGCERRVDLARRLSKIIADDRKDTVDNNL
jgi:hypothetical protein